MHILRTIKMILSTKDSETTCLKGTTGIKYLTKFNM